MEYLCNYEKLILHSQNITNHIKILLERGSGDYLFKIKHYSRPLKSNVVSSSLTRREMTAVFLQHFARFFGCIISTTIQ